jgi:hypothetical protein
MSAWDVAGIVLAALPLMIEGFDAYSEAPVIKLFTANDDRREFIRALRDVQAPLRFQMETLLINTRARLTPEQWQAIRSTDVNGAKFLEIWAEIMKDHPAIPETITSHELRYVVEDTNEILTDIVRSTGVSRDADLNTYLETIRNQGPRLSMTKTPYQSFKFVRSSRRRKKLLDRLKANVDSLRTLNLEQQRMEPLDRANRTDLDRIQEQCTFLQLVHDQCSHLHHALANVWKCDCHTAPAAFLRLQKREPCESLEFALFLTFEKCSSSGAMWEFRETEVVITPRYQISFSASN